MDCTQQPACKKPGALKVVNIGLQSFYDAVSYTHLACRGWPQMRIRV